MMWQDLIFLTGSVLSIVFLAPTLRDASACVPLGTSLPSMGIGAVYGATFASLGMTFSSFGAIAAGGMWALIALCRSPASAATTMMSRPERAHLFARDARRWGRRRVTRGSPVVDSFPTVSERPATRGHSREFVQSAD